MRVLVLSMTFPNPKQPTLGLFVKERLRHVARSGEVVIAAPVPWFPFNRLFRPRWHGVPLFEQTNGLRVYHPPFFCVPRYLKSLDGLWYAISLVPFLIKLRREFPFDLIDAHFVYPDGVAAALLGRIFRVPVTITLRGSIVRLQTYPLHRPQIRWALASSSRVLAVSQSLKDVAVGLGITAEKIRVIPNGVDAERFNPTNRHDARQALGLPADATILLSIGGLNEGKGFHRLVMALPELRRRCPNLMLVIVGGARPADSVRPFLERLIHERGLEQHVRLVGERPHDEIPLWMAACDLFCLATRSEGWSNVLLESLACGRPVVATRVGGNPEIVSSERLGILVDPADDAALPDAIRAALARSWNADELATHARQYSWGAAAAQVVEEFGRALALPAAPAPAGTTSVRAGDVR